MDKMNERSLRPQTAPPSRSRPDNKCPRADNGRSKPPNKRPKTGVRRPKARTHTDAELEKYLPRRSFFSCHERALKIGGYDPVTGRPVVALSGSKRPQTALAMKPDSRPVTPGIGAGIAGLPTRASTPGPKMTNVAAMANLIKRKNSRYYRNEYEDELVVVDFSVLLNYLRAVDKSENEYLATRVNRRMSHTADTVLSLVKLGQVYKEGHHGFGREEMVVVGAAYEIRPRMCNPALHNSVVDNKQIAQKRTPSPTPTTLPPKPIERDSDDTGTELERCRSRLWRWLRTVNTAQIHHAREAALREMGLEDYTLSYWWRSQRTCRYLRDNSSLAATDDSLYQFV